MRITDPWLNSSFGRISRACTALALLCAQGLFVSFAYASHEQGDQWRQTAWDDNHVIVFSDCGFSGRSKGLPIGDYRSLRKVGIEHNAISSIIIPQGTAVEIFQQRGFDGHWYRLNQNQICLKGNWNNRIGSIRVVEDDPRNSYGASENYQDDSGGRLCHPYSFEAIDSDGAIRFVDKAQNLTPVRAGRKIEGELCGDGQVRVEMAKKDRRAGAILNIADKQYEFRPWSQYDDFRSDLYRKYLTIDLPERKKNRGEMQYGQNGWGNTAGFGKRFSSGVESGDNWGNNYQGKWYKPAAPKQAKSGSNQTENCPAYVVSGNHPDTGIRFLTGNHEFHMIGNATSKRKLCHTGTIKVEMAKKRTEAKVVLSIGGKTYVFSGGDKGDRFQNGWYRKYYSVEAN